MTATQNCPENTCSSDSQLMRGKANRQFLRVVEANPNADNETVRRAQPPKRVANAELRSREHLSRDEIERLI